jgi:acetoin utilization deacetylase AcuC-like enzyme
MPLLYHAPLYEQHLTGRHPERPERTERVMRHLTEKRLVQRCVRPDWKTASDDQLKRIHCPDYVQSVRERCERGGGQLDPDTVASAKSYEAARLASGAACDAVRRVLAGEDRQALCLHRPPGHHALRDRAMGFCFFNHVAVAARAAIDDAGLKRVLIIDWDVHHGNGTQDAFYEDGAVAFYSIHRSPFYPGTGDASETGSGKGLGCVKNVPMAHGCGRETFVRQYRESLAKFADKVKPELVLVSAGFDAHHADPVGSLHLEVEDFATLTQVALDIAAAHAAGRFVSLLEGGYNLDILPLCVATHLETMLAAMPAS